MTAIDLPPVLMLHGWGGSGASTFSANGWREAFSDRELLIRDLPGHGPSASGDPLRYADLAGEVVATLPPGPVDLVGYSLGAKIALALLASGKAQIRRAVVGGVGDNAFAPEPDGEVGAQALEGTLRTEVPAFVRAAVDYALGNGNEAAAMAALLRRPPNPVLDAGRLPDGESVLLVNSEADQVAMPDVQLRNAMPKLHYIKLPDGGHLALPRDIRFRQAAVTFLSST